MNAKKTFNAISKIDDDLIDRSLNRKAHTTKSKGVWLRFGAIAACLAVIVTAIIALPKLRDPGDNPSNDVPAISVIKSGNTITGKQIIVYGDPSSANVGFADMIAPCFHIQTVIEAEVVEVLPDTYYYAASDYQPYHVAKLRVIDQIRGNGLPEEIYMRYPFYDTTVFDGYERFIMSLTQVGIDNYALINETQSRVDYFPNMFIVFTGDIGYGSVIAFNDGKVDDSFWEKTDYLVSKIPRGKKLFEQLLDSPRSEFYPATRNTTIGKVKSNIVQLAADKENWHVSTNIYNYVTADDVFVSDEAKEIRTYLEPSETNVFVCYLTLSEERVIAEYTRIINGFGTDEVILINGYDGENGNVSKSEVTYTEEDLAQIPDIGEALAAINLSELEAPHIESSEGMKLVYSNASGIYRNIDGNVYGIIRVIWCYKSPYHKNAYLADDMYYLYDEDGNGSIIERDELKEIIGDDIFIQSFPRGSAFAVLL